MSKKITAVVVQDALGVPHAYPVIVVTEHGKRKAYIVLEYEDRLELDSARRQLEQIERPHQNHYDGLGWCAEAVQVRDRSYEGGESVSFEQRLLVQWMNAETLAVETGSIVGRLPDVLYEGDGGYKRPVQPLCWHSARLIEAVRLAHALTEGKR